jgi:hypothetical protein
MPKIMRLLIRSPAGGVIPCALQHEMLLRRHGIFAGLRLWQDPGLALKRFPR